MRGLSSIWIPLFLFPRDSDWRVPFKVTLNPVTLVGVGSTDMNGMPLSLTLPESKENAVYTEIKHVSLNSKAYAAILHQSSSGNQNIKQKKDFIQCTFMPNPCISLKCMNAIQNFSSYFLRRILQSKQQNREHLKYFWNVYCVITLKLWIRRSMVRTSPIALFP